MESLIEILQEIRDGIYSMNSSIEDLKNSIDELRGNGLYNSIADLHDKLDEISDTLTGIKGVGTYDSISDVCDKLDEISSTLLDSEKF